MTQQKPDSGEPTLVVSNLQTHFDTRAGVVKAVDGVNLQVSAGEIVGLVGESGSGKSVTGFSIIGLVDPPGKVVGGSIRFKGEELVGQSDDSLRALRGNRIAMIFQDPMMTLNPVLRIDTQMVEAIHAHHQVSKAAAMDRARQALGQVGIPSPESRLKNYPHQLSGGMRQRVAIAIALLNEPDLIIADEPTTALDVTIQAQILFEVQALCRNTGTAMIWITHDLAVVAGLADRIAVMYAGKLVESGRTDEIIDQPMHPYTVGLLGSVPSAHPRGERLPQIPGLTPSLINLAEECSFRTRCNRAVDACAQSPQLSSPTTERTLRCHNPAPVTVGVNS
ncbi:MAG: ABC transporter ATP-binding protein [Burkholderiaceae bacterium]